MVIANCDSQYIGTQQDGKVPQLIKLSDNVTMSADTHMMFKAHVGIAIAMCMIGALLIIQVTLSFIGVLMCGNCCSGERAVGLFAYIFTMIGKCKYSRFQKFQKIFKSFKIHSNIHFNFRFGHCLLYSNWNDGYWLDLRFW